MHRRRRVAFNKFRFQGANGLPRRSLRKFSASRCQLLGDCPAKGESPNLGRGTSGKDAPRAGFLDFGAVNFGLLHALGQKLQSGALVRAPKVLRADSGQALERLFSRRRLR
jgi:hypothetical protein